MGYVPAVVACPYDENSASAGSKFDGPAYGSMGIPAAAVSGTTLENHIADTVRRQPVMRK